MKALRLPLTLVLAAGLGAGCAVARPVRTVVISAPVIIHICDSDTATAMRLKLTGDPTRVNGWLDVDRREIWCINDPKIIVHELRHLAEWDGLWHVTGYSGRQIEVVDQSTAVIE